MNRAQTIWGTFLGSYILLIIALLFAGCQTPYVMDGDRCRDTQTGKYVETDLCR